MKTLSDRWLIVLALLGVFIFFAVNLDPSLQEEPAEQLEAAIPIDKEYAADNALQFAQQYLNVNEPAEVSISYQIDKMVSGYVQKEQHNSEYMKRYGDQAPLEFFRAELNSDNGHWLIDLHMVSGEVFAWQSLDAAASNVAENSSADLAVDIAQHMLRERSLDHDDWIVDDTHPAAEDSTWVYLRTSEPVIDQSHMMVYTLIQEDRVISFHPELEVPADFVAWMDEQDLSANRMGLIGLGINALMLIGAIVFAIMIKRWVPFSRGIILSIVYLALYVIHYINMYPGFRSMMELDGGDSHGMAVFMIVFSIITIVPMAILVYFSLTVGDGMWKQQGRNLWGRWRESDYGNHVLSAMGRGYLFCFMILGLQQVIFWIGYRFFDIWAISDPLMSPYNLIYPFLFPLLSWAAAISEEAIYRLFGIALFQKIFRSLIVAVLASNMIWALGHTAYPIYPAYTRFIEVTILGLVFTYIFFKYGFKTAVFAHAAVDCILIGATLALMDPAAYSGWALFYIASPAIVGYLIFWLYRLFPKKAAPPRLES